MMKKWRGNKWSKAWFILLLVGLGYDVLIVTYNLLTNDWNSATQNLVATFIMSLAIWLVWRTHHD